MLSKLGCINKEDSATKSFYKPQATLKLCSGSLHKKLEKLALKAVGSGLKEVDRSSIEDF